MKLARIALLASLVLALSLPGFARTEQEIRSEIDDVLMDPGSKESLDWWRGLGPSAPSIIQSMYSEERSLGRRLHLLKGLGAFNDPAVADFLKQQATDAQDSVVRNQSIRVLGSSQGPASEDFVSKFLTHPDPQTRLAAAQTLQKIGDPRAKELYDKYLSEEKTPWLVAKLKGEPPKPLALAPVSSSEDRLSPDLTGTWKGYLVSPKPGPSGMSSVAAALSLEVSGASEIKGSLALKEKDKVRALSLGQGKGKGSKFTGILSGPAAAPGKASEELSVEAELLPQSSSGKLLELRDTRTGATLIVRKEP